MAEFAPRSFRLQSWELSCFLMPNQRGWPLPQELAVWARDGGWGRPKGAAQGWAVARRDSTHCPCGLTRHPA